MGTARDPVAGSGDCPACTARVSGWGVLGPEWAIKIKCLDCNFKILSRLGVVCYVVACPYVAQAPVTRLLAALFLAILPLGVAAGDKPSKARAGKVTAKVSKADFTKD